MIDEMDRILCCRFLVSVGEVKLSTSFWEGASWFVRGIKIHVNGKWLRYPSGWSMPFSDSLLSPQDQLSSCHLPFEVNKKR